MQRKIGTEIELSKTLSPIDSIGALSAIDRTASGYLNAGEKVRRIKKPIETGTYDAETTRIIAETLALVFQGMLEDRYKDIDTAHSSYFAFR